MTTTPDRSLWDAVDKLVSGRRVKIDRQVAPETDESWLIRAQTDLAGACSVPLHDRAVASHRSATVVWANVPSLWDQSTQALYGSESAGGKGSKPLRERSIADFNLIEIRTQITEAVRAECERLGDKPRTDEFIAFGEIRHLASLVTAQGVDAAEEWAFRLGSWARALETYLQAGEHEVRPVRLRNSPCPTCGTRQVTIYEDGENRIVPALLIRFREGLVQAAVCEACGDSWWRGEQLEHLAALLGVPGLSGDTPTTAEAC